MDSVLMFEPVWFILWSADVSTGYLYQQCQTQREGDKKKQKHSNLDTTLFSHFHGRTR